jgi:16S rRNA (guanine966-N2)-methyltransferase
VPVRVIAGSLGGRRLKVPSGRVTRPTADRVKEALFAMLGSVEGASVLDLYAGTGALGIEALSRGAERAVFVELDARVSRVLKDNLEALGLGCPPAEVRRMDALAALRSARGRKETYDLLFIDPPYEQARRLSSELGPALSPLLKPGACVVVESDRRAPLELPLTGTGELEVARQRRYGDTSITIHRHP